MYLLNTVINSPKVQANPKDEGVSGAYLHNKTTMAIIYLGTAPYIVAIF